MHISQVYFLHGRAATKKLLEVLMGTKLAALVQEYAVHSSRHGIDHTVSRFAQR